MNFLRTCLCLALVAFLPAPLLACGPIGHMTVAYIAYQSFSPETKVRVRELLKLNPDYANWEKQIPSGTSADDHDRMIFMIASTWADDIKTEAQYSDDGADGGNTPGGASSSQNIGYSDLLRHRYWHFVNTPFSPDQTPLPEIPTPDAQTQIVVFRAVLASSQPDELKSYDLVWLVHLIGDVHQPLHAVTRFTKSYPKGDGGGNLLKLFGDADANLHSYWDDLPGTDLQVLQRQDPVRESGDRTGEGLSVCFFEEPQPGHGCLDSRELCRGANESVSGPDRHCGSTVHDRARGLVRNASAEIGEETHCPRGRSLGSTAKRRTQMICVGRIVVPTLP